MIASLLPALLIGLVAGLRAMTAPAAVSWAAHLGWIDLSESWLAFLGHSWTPWIFTALAAAFGRDLPAALIEDVAAVGGAILVVAVLA